MKKDDKQKGRASGGAIRKDTNDPRPSKAKTPGRITTERPQAPRVKPKRRES